MVSNSPQSTAHNQSSNSRPHGARCNPFRGAENSVPSMWHYMDMAGSEATRSWSARPQSVGILNVSERGKNCLKAAEERNKGNSCNEIRLAARHG